MTGRINYIWYDPVHSANNITQSIATEILIIFYFIMYTAILYRYAYDTSLSKYVYTLVSNRII